MAIVVTNRKVNLMGNMNVVFGDITLTVASQELVTGLKHITYFQATQDKKGQVSAVFNSKDGAANSKNGSMWVSGGNSILGAGNLPASAKFMAIGI